MRRAYCTPRWPSPPTPNTATKSPALACASRSAERWSGQPHQQQRSIDRPLRVPRSSRSTLRSSPPHNRRHAARRCSLDLCSSRGPRRGNTDGTHQLPPETDASALTFSPRRRRRSCRSVRPLRDQAPSPHLIGNIPRRSRNLNENLPPQALDANANLARGWSEQRLFSKFAGAHGMNRAIGRRTWHNLPSSLVRMAGATLRFRHIGGVVSFVSADSSPQLRR